MGHSKINSSLKSTTPIQFPHDGPIFHHKENGLTEDDASIVLASQILSGTASNSPTNDLCRILQGASTTKEQLQALQSYRNIILNLKKKKDVSSLPDEATETALYRLLLEWSLSTQTPVPLQRAIQSNLKTTETRCKETSKQVLESLWKHPQRWENALYSLEVAVNSPVLVKLLGGCLLSDCLCCLFQTKISKYLADTTNSSLLLDEGLVIADILKILLNNIQDEESVTFLQEIQQFVLLLLSFPNMPTDGFITLGVLHGKLLFFLDQKTRVATAISTVDNLDALHSEMSCLARLSMVQGIAASLDLDSLTTTDSALNESPLEVCWKYSLQTSQVATDPTVRWAALRGLSTLASRWKQQQAKTSARGTTSTTNHDELIQQTLHVVLQAWENPPLRKLGTAIPGLFKSLVKLLHKDQLVELCRRVLEQPVNRKGRYLALEILLPYIPPEQSIHAESLLEGVGDRGPNTGPIADLWAKLLGHAWKELEKLSNGFETWKSHWVASLSRALVAPSLSRRKQVAAFCFPRLVDLMKSFETLRPHLSLSFKALFVEIEHLKQENDQKKSLDPMDSLGDRALWAQLEIARHTTMYKLSSSNLRQTIATGLPASAIRMALTHSAASIRLVAFQSIESVVVSYSGTIEGEDEMWRYAFPYAVKTTESKEYTSGMLQCLSTFLDRLSAWEAGEVETPTSPREQGSYQYILPKLHAFTVNFLINDVIVRKGAYPGTVADKEAFSLALLECLLTFVTRDQAYNSDNYVAKKGFNFNRRRSEMESATVDSILHSLLSCEVLSALFGLLHSNWDGTRAIAFRFLSKLTIAGHVNSVPLPIEYSSLSARRAMQARGVYLASSPRQREADSGARILAFLYMTLEEAEEKEHYLGSLVNLMESRLNAMKDKLRGALEGFPSLEEGDGVPDDWHGLPLAHGIVHAVRLAIEHQRIRRRLTRDPSKANNTFYEDLIEVLCQAIQMCLAVVADVRDGETIEGMENEVDFGADGSKKKNNKDANATPLNVNAGTIGANGTVSKLTSTDEKETTIRLAVQRIVIGSWLLTKETCATVAAVITAEGYQVPFASVEKVGTLLISTLTSLKHTGAAFAARDSLQEIATAILSSATDAAVIALPKLWAKRLFDEISLTERVRDSTLRRSAGYALGFLAIMRAELSTTSGPTVLCPWILENILMYSLPPDKQVRAAFEKLTLSSKTSENVVNFFSSSSSSRRFFVADNEYEVRCRVHALNVLRLIILDAPLASAVRPFIGDAVVSAILGYNDSAWSVRNSATMVFSAAMTRVVDADKNASNNDRTSSNAITVAELFRRYPPLASFLPSVMQSSLADTGAYSQIFPILLLLSRVQPIAHSGGSATTMTENFPSTILKCLGNKHHAIRAAAARALANISSEDQTSLSSSSALLGQCKAILQQSLDGGKEWNMVDGALLAIHALVTSSDSSKSVFRSIQMTSTLMPIIGLDKRGPLCPPCCVSTALETLVAMSQSDDAAGDRAKIVLACESLASNSGFDTLIGGANLYSISARNHCSILQQDLWKPASEAHLQTALDGIADLFISKLIDVRISAVKSFKKSIYQNIDDLLDGGDTNSGVIFSSTIRMLIEALRCEMGRGRNSDERIGPHIPTVRRVSRCLLECLYGFMSFLNASSNSLSSVLSDSDCSIVWSTSLEMVEFESFLDESYDEPNGETFLSGNAAELMSISIAREKMRQQHHTVENVDIFVRVIKRLNNPQASWRSRYSAAVAIKTSQVLLNSAVPTTGVQSNGLQKRFLIFELLGMLQDADSDVRAASVRAVRQLDAKGLPQVAVSSSLPELTLQQLYPEVYQIGDGEGMKEDKAAATTNALLQTMLDNCSGVLEKLTWLEEEFRNTRNEASSSIVTPNKDLVNAATTRKIFEIEDPNPSYERILANQLATQSLLKLSLLGWPSADLESNRKALFAILASCLDVIWKHLNVGGMIHDMTRFPTIFPALHSLINAVAATLYLGAIDEEGIQASTEAILAGIVDRRLLHPDIVSSLQSLANAQKGDIDTAQAIEKGLFLVR